MSKKEITNPDALNDAASYEKPSAFSRGIKMGTDSVDFLFISGTASIDNNGKSIHIGNFAEQTKRTYYNIKKLLEAEGATWGDVVKTTVYIKDIKKHYDEFNRLRIDFFKEEGVLLYPASVGVQAALCRDELLIEMDAIAIVERRHKI